MFINRSITPCFALVLLVTVGLRTASSAEPTAVELFESKIRPVLVEVCFKCHGGDKDSGSLRVDSREALLKGGDTSPAIVPSKPAESLLLKAIRHTDDDLKMPPDKRLPDETIAAFEAWIAAGAPWPEGRAAGFQAKRHWAFQPVVSPPLPKIKNQKSEIENPLDAYIQQKLDEFKLTPSPPADRRTLIRRASFDLLGLPPTWDEIVEFENDSSPDAVERLIDRLLASPRYGERWGRYWLDVSRYADTKGYVFMEDRNYPFAYTYRDWVIRALNEDVSYDQFLIRQLAADLLPEPDRSANLPALGFLTLGRRFLNNINDIIDDRIDVICRGTMALTVGCARCHDHKYDPIPAADYYSLYGVLRSSHEPKPEDAKTLMAMTLTEEAKPFDPYIFLRGQQGNHGPQVPRQFLSVVAGSDRKPFANRSGRLELAQAIASPTNPLTARVIVNRVWLHHFGAPLVSTPSDFGLRADPPSHPELLDWLATELIAHDWSLKWLHREIMASRVYRQASMTAARPDNSLLSHANRQRLDWESLRDSLLYSSGRLNGSVGGAATDILKAPYSERRTIYGFIDRQNLPLTFRNFDFASPDTHTPSRFVTSVPQQTLFLRNSPFVLELSRAFAARASGTNRVAELFRLAYGRDPTADEVQLAEQFLAEAELEATPTPIWQFGYGEYDSAATSLKSFSALPHWTGKQWQGGPTLPDPKLGWVLWNPNGGHPGDAQHAAVLRWTAPRDVTVVITGTLKHPNPEGDGVQAVVSSNKLGEKARWIAANQSVETFVPAIKLRRGESLDFIVTSRASVTNDSFQWAPKLAAVEKGFSTIWDIARDFPKTPTGQPIETALTPWEQLAQVLLLSNEFQFVD
ncbi:MAG: PSD1 and planctomycete cytochrome C domain-containing protein [Planctomycetaceae bacterium]